MKRFLLAALLLLPLGSAVFAQTVSEPVTARTIYEKYASRDGVSAVYVSPMMFRIFGRMPQVQMAGREEGVDLAPVIRSLSGLFLLDASNAADTQGLTEDVDRYVHEGSYALMLEAKDAGELTRVYTRSKGDVVKSLVLLTCSASQTLFLGMDGEIPMQELEKVMQK